MRHIITTIYRIILQVLCMPVFLKGFFNSATGREYGVTFWKKVVLLFRMIRNNYKITSGSTFIEHAAMVTTLFEVPRSLEGVVVECGTYKGVSAANLSLACALVNRRLEIFDCFEGLPEPSDRDSIHHLIQSEEIHTYAKGSWYGSLEEVKENITRYGDISVCNFNKGLFENTLPHFQKKCVQVFVDADYRSSLETSIRHLWPLLQDGCFFYCHEVGHMEIASLFFSDEWWRNHLKIAPPGLVGAGTGMGIKILSGTYFNSSMGYTIKNPQIQNFVRIPQLGGIKLNFSASIKLVLSSESTKTKKTANK